MYVLLILCLPLLSGLIQALPFNLRQAHKNQISQLCLLSAFILSVSSIYCLNAHETWTLSQPLLGEWVLNIVIYFDALTWIMLSLVTFISLIIHHYSSTYMFSDLSPNRFMSLLSLLTTSVLLLVTSGSLLTALIAWQLKGFILYFMLNYYHKSPKANLCARRKLAINRFGDFCFLIAVLLSVQYYASTEFTVLFQHASEMSTVILLLVFVAIMTKSAQFPFHKWLVNSMEAPTPVSALMHAGIVNAGGFLLARMSPLYVEAPGVLFLIFTVGIVTALFGNLFMKHQPDVKKEMAYSTVSQMGFMVMQCGLGAFASAIFHLFAHSMLKSTQFLSAGSNLNFNKATVRQGESKRQYPVLLLSGLISGALIGLTIAYFMMTNQSNMVHPLILFFIGITLFQLVRETLDKPIAMEVRLLKMAVIVLAYSAYLYFYIFFKGVLEPTILSESVHFKAELGIVLALLPIVLFKDRLLSYIKKQHPNWVVRLYALTIFENREKGGLAQHLNHLLKDAKLKLKTQATKIKYVAFLGLLGLYSYVFPYHMITEGVVSGYMLAYGMMMYALYCMVLMVKKSEVLWMSIFITVMSLTIFINHRALLLGDALNGIGVMNLAFFVSILIGSYFIQYNKQYIRQRIVKNALRLHRPIWILTLLSVAFSGISLVQVISTSAMFFAGHNALYTLMLGSTIFLIIMTIFNFVESLYLRRGELKKYSVRPMSLIPFILLIGVVGTGFYQ